MTNLEREYFSTFTLERLKALYKAVSKEAKRCGANDYFTGIPIYNYGSYVTRVWMRPDGKQITININKRKIREAIKEREELLKTN